jgi:hypothetical protein
LKPTEKPDLTGLTGGNGHEAVAPPGLSPQSAVLWQQLLPWAKSQGRRLLLEQMLLALDRGDEFSRLIAAEGLTTVTKTTGVVRLNPLVKAEHSARMLVAKLAALLHLNWVDGR